MKTKSTNNTLYVITAIASVVVILLAAVGFTNVEAQKVERVSADSNFISRAESAAELAASMGVENDVYQARVQNVAGDNDDDLGRMAEALKPIAEYSTDSAALDREVKYLLGGTDTYATTYGGICAAAGEAYRMDLDAANHDAAVWTAVCAVLALAGVAGLVISVTRIEYGRHRFRYNSPSLYSPLKKARPPGLVLLLFLPDGDNLIAPHLPQAVF